MNQSIEYAARQGFQIAALSKAPITAKLDSKAPDFSSVACFPFNGATVEKLSNSTGAAEGLTTARAKALEAWGGVVAAVGGNEILLLQTSLRKSLVPKGKKLLDPKESLKCVAWAIDPRTFGPLLLFAGEQAIIYAWDPTSNQMRGLMRGHGGPIYDIAVLPAKPFIFASASRDKSVRVYDLTLQASTVLLEPDWPITASTRPLRLGKGAEGSAGRRGRNHPQPTDVIGTIGGPFGSQVPESLGGEGTGLGKCFLILRGSSKGSGGHHASVLAIAFHPKEPLIATAGVDHRVKIWRIPEILTAAAPRRLTVQDKPVFSSSCVHESYVNSIHWLSPEVLVSRSCGRNATVVVWKWLELQRFSPKDPNAPVRHLPSDYNDSRSFTILAKSSVAAFGREDRRLAIRPADPLGQQAAWIGLPSSKGDIVLWEVSSIPPQLPLAAPERPDWRVEQKLLETSSHGENSEDEYRLSGGSDDDDYGTSRTPQKRKSGKGKLVVMSPTVSDESEHEGSESDPQTSSKEPAPSWVPSARLTFDEAIDSLPANARSQWSQGVGVQCVAFPPHGLQYIVGVGEGQTIAVWKRS